VAALGIGFAFGTLRHVDSNETESAETSDDVAVITFQGKSGTASESSGSASTIFGIIQFSNFEDANSRLQELMIESSRLTSYQQYTSPLAAERLIEEIEQILSLANESQLVALLSGDELGNTSPLVVGIAFEALARLSPTRAAEAGLELWTDEAMPPMGLPALIREWNRKDPAAVERWIENLDSEVLQSQSRQTLFTLTAGSDPWGAVERLEEVDPELGHGVSSVLAQTLTEAKLPEEADRFLVEREDGTTAVEMLPSFLAGWGERDPDSMMEWLFSQNLDLLGPDKLQQSLQGLAVKNPEGFLGKIEPAFAGNAALQKVAGQAWWSWLASDKNPTGAIQWFGEHGDLSAGFEKYQIADWAVNGDDWTAERTSLVLDAFAQLPDTDFKSAFSQGFFERLSRYQPKAVLPFALEHLPLGHQSDSTIARAVGNWAAQGEAEDAVRWSLENLDGRNALGDAVRFSISRWAETDAPAAAEFAMSLPQEQKDDAFSGLSSSWARKDPEAVLSFLQNASDPEGVSSLTRGSFRWFGEDKSGAKYLPAALEMPPGKMRSEAVRGLFGGWALSNAEAAVDSLEKVPQGGLRNAAILGFNSFAARRDPALAMELASRISVEADRKRELIFRGKSWMKKDATAAEAAIRANPAISESIRTEIFK